MKYKYWFLFILFSAGCGVGSHMPLSVIPKEESLFENVSYKRDLLPIFQQQCASCHNATSPSSQPNWMDYKTAFAKKNELRQRVWVSRDMPPNKDLSDRDRQLIAAWVSNGAPEEVAAQLEQNESTPETHPTMMSRGEYLVRASNCLTCHTSLSKNAAPGAGGRKMETPFGLIVTPNITPDKDTGIGKWTFEDFYQAMHLGIRKDGSYLFPVFPYTFFTKMSRDDVYSIFSYLKTLNPEYREVETNQLRFPFNVRLFQSIWRKLYFDEGTFEPDPTKSSEWNRGAYLVTGPAHCGACHSPRNFMGGIKENKKLMGSAVDHWYAPSLAASSKNYGMNNWSVEDLTTFFKTGSMEGKQTVIGPMSEVIYDGLKFLDLSDLRSIAVYIKYLSSTEGKFQMERAQQDYLENCATCHKASGTGVRGQYPSLAQNKTINFDDPTNLINVIILGIQPRAGKSSMPSFMEKLNDQQIADIVNYIRLTWGDHTMSLVTAEVVSKQRKVLAQ